MGASTKAVTDATFDVDVLKNSKPVLEEIAQEYGSKIDIVKLNVDENPRVVQLYRVMNIPTLSVFKDGQVVKEIVGAKPKSALLRELEDFIS